MDQMPTVQGNFNAVMLSEKFLLMKRVIFSVGINVERSRSWQIYSHCIFSFKHTFNKVHIKI
jgi:hypothetical protein